jgi:hypothetical protein
MSKIAVIGMGYWGQNMVRKYHEPEWLKADCDINMDALFRNLPN